MTKSITDLPLINYRISLHCPAPTKKRRDKEEALTTAANAERGAFKVQQERIPTKYQKPISASQAKIRKYFEDNCFRLNDSYAIPIPQFEAFEAGFNKLLVEHDVHVNALCEAINSGDIIEEAKRRLGDDFDESYIPENCDAVRSAIRVNIRTIADLGSPVIAEALGNLAADTKAEVEDRVREDMAKAEAEGQTSIVSFVMDEIVLFLNDVNDRCTKGAERTHYKTMVDKFTRVVEKLPNYNVTGNPAIQDAIDRIFTTFKSLDKDALKADAEYRAEQADNAKSILADLSEANLF